MPGPCTQNTSIKAPPVPALHVHLSLHFPPCSDTLSLLLVVVQLHSGKSGVFPKSLRSLCLTKTSSMKEVVVHV